MTGSKTERIRFRDGLTCICVVTSLPLVEQDMIKRGLIKRNIDIYQLGYRTDVAASAGTHARGGNTDVGQFSDAQLAVWREWGWTIQHRTRAQGFDLDHGHGWPKGCPHLSSGGRSQAAEWERGRNGLRSRGPIAGPRPKGASTPTWKAALRGHHESPSVDEGLFPMSTATAVKLRRNTDFKLARGGFVTVPVDETGNVTIMSGPARFCVAATISLSGLAPDRAVWARFVIADYKKGEKTTTHYAWPAVLIRGGQGEAAGQVVIPYDSFRGGTGGHSRRLRLQLSSPDSDVTVTDIQIRAGKA